MAKLKSKFVCRHAYSIIYYNGTIKCFADHGCIGEMA
jgi:hypothetical protein